MMIQFDIVGRCLTRTYAINASGGEEAEAFMQACNVENDPLMLLREALSTGDRDLILQAQGLLLEAASSCGLMLIMIGENEHEPIAYDPDVMDFSMREIG